MNKIFQRTVQLIGANNLHTLHDSTVAIIGLGGVGSYAVEAICRAGIGKIIIVDPDKIDPSNINRQLPALVSTVGKYKTDLIASRLLDINPHVIVEKHTTDINQDKQAKILSGKIDYVVDAIDSVPDKIELIKYCLTNKIPIASAMGTANRLDPSLLKIDDIQKTHTCPLARKVRYELRKNDIHKGVTAVYSTEPPIATEYDGDSRLGTISFVPGVAGLLLASVVIRRIIDYELF